MTADTDAPVTTSQVNHRPLKLPHIFPSHNYWGEENLHRFVYKASFGSYWAPLTLENTQKALVERVALEEPWHCQKTYLESLASSIPSAPPYPSPQPWLDRVLHSKITTTPIKLTDAPRHPCKRYEYQWESPNAEYGDLIHDAFLHCWNNWSGQEFVRLTRASLVNDEIYNSLELMAGIQRRRVRSISGCLRYQELCY
ncbi:MAG: hypothetical protein P1V97_24225 [Planctomycetota bacterium]|nr:hypothetical protein [Planctomycetota bacterium]